MRKILKKIKNKIIFLIIITLLFFQFWNITLSVYAQSEWEDNSLCYRPSEELQQYLNFSEELITILNTAQFEKKKDQSVHFNGLFSKNSLQYPKESLNFYKKTAKLAWLDTQRAILAGGAWVLSSMINLSEFAMLDGILGLTMLFRKEIFVRDLEHVQDISNRIQEITAHLILHLNQDKLIWPQMAWKINALLDRYSWKDLFFAVDDNNQRISSVSAGTRYYTLTSIFSRLAMNMKQFLIIPQKSDQYFVDVLMREENNFIDKTEGIKIIPNYSTIKIMAQKYNKITMSTHCVGSLKKFMRDLKKSASIGKDAIKSWEMMKHDIERLRATLLWIKQVVNIKNNRKTKNDNAWISKVLTDEQIEILRGVYGIDAARITKFQWLGLTSLFAPPPKLSSPFDDSARSFLKEQSNIINKTRAGAKNISHNILADFKKWEKGYIKKYAEEQEKIKTFLHDLKYTKPSERKNTLKSALYHNLDTIFAEHEQANLLNTVNETKILTSKIRGIGKIIHETKEIIGTTQDKDTINDNLTELCEKACSNKGNSWCRWTLKL